MSICEQGMLPTLNQGDPVDPLGCRVDDGLTLDVLDSWNTGR
ncbi:hypothetical protein [Halomonas cupida]